MKLGIISGSGSYTWPLADACERVIATAYGDVLVTEGRVGDVESVHVSRHEAGHARLSSGVRHKANMAALLETGVTAVVSLTVCGAVDPTVPLGSLVVFDDLYFPSNRFPDGTLCTWYDEPGDQRRGHWIFPEPFSASLRAAVLAAAGDLPFVDGGCYGHVDGPRFNTAAEIRGLASAGVTAVSQTGGPEIVLAGEAELPLVLVGYTTDYATGVAEPESVSALIARLEASGALFAALVEALATTLPDSVTKAGVVYRFEG